ncbi:MAG: substrate-binding domain-containing protein, partial [Ruthenibacterium lactatiformans]
MPNSNARQLKVQQNRSIIIVVKGAFNMFFAAILERMQSLISAPGTAPRSITWTRTPMRCWWASSFSASANLWGSFSWAATPAALRHAFPPLPCPALATTLADHLNFGNLSSVGIDDTAAGRRAPVSLSRGHRRIAVIGGNWAVSSISDQRYQGFLQGFADEGLSHDEALYQKANYNLGSGYRAMNKLLARDAGFTAVFCMSDIMAVGAMRALTDAGLRVPQDISVLGFDGIELGQYVVPRLATVSQPQQEIADQSVALLLGQIE